VFGIFAALAEFERELIRERTIAGLLSARARGRNGGRPYTMTPARRDSAKLLKSKAQNVS
jgi:DNA invertase Pin-like site-specific DNA recombinase